MTLCVSAVRNCKYKCNIYSKHDYTNFILNKYKYFINQHWISLCIMSECGYWWERRLKLSRHHSWQTGDLSALRFKIFHVMTWLLPPVVTAVKTVRGLQSPRCPKTWRHKTDQKTFHAMSGHSHPSLCIRFCHSSCILARISSVETATADNAEWERRRDCCLMFVWVC